MYRYDKTSARYLAPVVLFIPRVFKGRTNLDESKGSTVILQMFTSLRTHTPNTETNHFHITV